MTEQNRIDNLAPTESGNPAEHIAPVAPLIESLRKHPNFYPAMDGGRWYRMTEPDPTCVRAASVIEVLLCALEDALELASVAERNQDSEWYADHAQLSRFVEGLRATEPSGGQDLKTTSEQNERSAVEDFSDHTKF